jgi:hypothetical protein
MNATKIEKNLREWKCESHERMIFHKKQSKKYEIIFYCFALPEIIIWIIITSDILYSFMFDDCNCDSFYKAEAAKSLISTFGTAFSAIQLFVNNKGKSEEHKKASNNFMIYIRNLDNFMNNEMDKNEFYILDKLTLLNLQYENHIRNSPDIYIPNIKYKKRKRKKFTKKIIRKREDYLRSTI